MLLELFVSTLLFDFRHEAVPDYRFFIMGDSHDRHALCVHILTAGYVQSFVDFFYLTHKPEPAAPASAADEAAEDRFVLPVEQLEFVRGSLCDAEAARRQSQTKEVFGSYQSLASLFAEMDDYRTSVYFREKCLEISKLVADTEGELIASRELGAAHEKLHNVPESIKYYEKAHQLAQGDPEHGEKANRDLVHVRAARRARSNVVVACPQPREHRPAHAQGLPTRLSSPARRPIWRTPRRARRMAICGSRLNFTSAASRPLRSLTTRS
jgi:tetratricopeptide (TPR) repeat protein